MTQGYIDYHRRVSAGPFEESKPRTICAGLLFKANDLNKFVSNWVVIANEVKSTEEGVDKIDKAICFLRMKPRILIILMTL